MLVLHPYQEEGVEWLKLKPFRLLGDEMGLGKTAQAITAADELYASKVLIVCRAVARLNWKHEFKLFSRQNRRITVVEGARTKIQIKNGSVTICSYEGIDKVLRALDPADRFDLVVVDEGHFVKSISSKRSKNVYGGQGLIRRTNRMWVLTGTPTPNHAGEAWLPLFVSGATPLSHDQFLEKFCDIKDFGFGKTVTGSKKDPDTIREFQKLMSKIMLRRTLDDSDLNLPGVSFETAVVPKGKVNISHNEQFGNMTIAELNQKIEDEYAIIDSIFSSGKMSDELLEMLKALSQSIATLRRYIGLQKVEGTADLLRFELESDKKLKTVLFAHHRAVLSALADELKEFNPVVVMGGVNPTNAHAGIQRFQDPDSDTRVFIGQTEAAGTSITLTASHEVVCVEQSWTPASNSQAISRCRRIGQVWPVRVRNIAIDDPADLRISELIRSKTEALTKLYSKGE